MPSTKGTVFPAGALRRFSRRPLRRGPLRVRLPFLPRTLTFPFSRHCSYHYNGNAETYWWMGKRPADAIAKMKGWVTD